MNRTFSIPQQSNPAVEKLEAGALDIVLADTHPKTEYQRLFPPAGSTLPGVVVGRLVGLGDNGELLVRLPGDSVDVSRPARTTVSIDATRLGTEVVLMFEDGNFQKPVILGLLGPKNVPTALPIHTTVDDETLELTADREIVLRCGKASITLTRAGKIIIRGEYVVSRSAGVNALKGGSVQIN